MKKVHVAVLAAISLLSTLGMAQSGLPAGPSAITATNGVVPPLIPFSSVATDAGGNSMSGVVSITFSLYSSQQGGEPLWTEKQNNVQLDPTGHYSVQLGITQPNGVPATLFTSGEARWLGIQLGEEASEPRVLLLSVPYAMKAGDAATIGGLPPSAFVLAAPPAAGAAAAYTPASADESANQASVSAATASDVTTSGGTVGTIAAFSTATNIQSSLLSQTTKTVNVAGKLNLPATGTATATAGDNSQPLDFAASLYNSTSGAAVNQTFQWQAEAVPSSNDTASPSATLNLLFFSGTNKAAETGLNIASNGQITFASGQTFPNTIAGVTTASGSGLTGGGSSGTLSLSLTNTCAADQVLQWSGTAWACSSTGAGTITGVTAGTGLKGGGTSGAVTLNVDTTKIPQLGVADTFTANQTIDGTGTAGNYGLTINQPSQSGILLEAPETGVGAGLDLLTTGTGGLQWEILDTGATAAQGANKLNFRNVTKAQDLMTLTGGGQLGLGTTAPTAQLEVYAVGATKAQIAMISTGTDAAVSLNNTASGGREYLLDSGSGSAGVGAGNFAVWDNTAEAPRLVVNSTGNVGIGTKTPLAALDIPGNSMETLIGNPGCGSGTFAGIGFATTGFNNCTNYSMVGDGTNTYVAAPTGTLYFRVSNNTDTAMAINSAGQVGIGTQTPGAQLEVDSVTAGGYAVTGRSPSFGVYGAASGASVEGADLGLSAGVWGNTGGTSGKYAAVVGTADSNIAGAFYSVTDTSSSLYAENDSGWESCQPLTGCYGPWVFSTYGGPTGQGTCEIDTFANLYCTGDVSDAVSVDGGARRIALYSTQSTENWFEDAGSGQLSNGSVRIELDPTFAQTVNTGVEYHVFLTPKGDCKGLYVSNESATGFEVHELGGGTSSIAFDYRIMAKRVGHENVRLADLTEQFKKLEAQRQSMRRAARPSAESQVSPAALPVRAAVQPAAAQPR